jgi:hypothetical protein
LKSQRAPNAIVQETCSPVVRPPRPSVRASTRAGARSRTRTPAAPARRLTCTSKSQVASSRGLPFRARTSDSSVSCCWRYPVEALESYRVEMFICDAPAEGNKSANCGQVCLNALCSLSDNKKSAIKSISFVAIEPGYAESKFGPGHFKLLLLGSGPRAHHRRGIRPTARVGNQVVGLRHVDSSPARSSTGLRHALE